MNYMIDTCIFNHLLDGFYSVDDLPMGEYFITHIQHDELQATKNADRRNELLRTLHVVSPNSEPTSVFVPGVSRLNQACLGNGKYYSQILSKLDFRKNKKSNCNDAIIGDTAINLSYTLITGDRNFYEVVLEVWDREKVLFWDK